MIDLKNAGQYIRAFLKIRTKAGKIEPFRLNAPQKKLYNILKEEQAAGRPIRIIILKARQLGFSTMTEGLIFHDTATGENVSSMIVAHREDATANLFRMSRLFYDELPGPVKPMLKASNAQELVFENPTRDPAEKKRRPGLRSRIRCVTAGGKGIGRGDTLQNLHASEYAFWTGDKAGTLLGLLQAVPALPGTMVIIESTANGFDDFKRRWDAAAAGLSDFRAVFFAWWENPDYAMPAPAGMRLSREELALQKAFDLTPEQLQWRRWCIQNNCGGDEALFRQEYPATPEEAFLTSGRPVFQNAELLPRREKAPRPRLQGEFRFAYDGLEIGSSRFAEDERGMVKVYQPPEPGVPYVIGGDTAGEGCDYFVAQVIDNRTGRQAAVLRCRDLGEEEYAHQVYCLGKWYNWALVGVENNYSSYPTRELERLGYPRLYVREVEDSFTHRLRKSYGFLTTAVTRPVLIAGLQTLMRQTPEAVVDRETLSEMLTFIYNERRRPEAQAGAHDDLVLALGIAHFIRGQQSFERLLPEPEPAPGEGLDYDSLLCGGELGRGYLTD